jgi:hypothetical protein
LLIDYGPLSLKQLSVVSYADAPPAPEPPNTSLPIPPSPPIESPPAPPGAPVPPLPLPPSLVAQAGDAGPFCAHEDAPSVLPLIPKLFPPIAPAAPTPPSILLLLLITHNSKPSHLWTRMPIIFAS